MTNFLIFFGVNDARICFGLRCWCSSARSSVSEYLLKCENTVESSEIAPHMLSISLSSGQYLLLQPLQHGGQQGLPVLLVGLHLLLKLFLGVLDEVVVLLEGLLDHLALVLPLLRQVLQQLSLLALEGDREH